MESVFHKRKWMLPTFTKRDGPTLAVAPPGGLLFKTVVSAPIQSVTVIKATRLHSILFFTKTTNGDILLPRMKHAHVHERKMHVGGFSLSDVEEGSTRMRALHYESWLCIKRVHWAIRRGSHKERLLDWDTVWTITTDRFKNSWSVNE